MSLNIVGTTFVTLRLAEIGGKTQPAVPWSPRAPLPSPFDSLRSLRTTPRFTGGIPNERPPAMAGTRFEGSLAAASRQPLAVFVGAAGALLLVTALGVLVGEGPTRLALQTILHEFAALLFIVIEIVMLFSKGD